VVSATPAKPVVVEPPMAHRLTGGATIGLVVAVLLLFAAAGAAVALMVRGDGDPSPLPTFPRTGNATPSVTPGATAAPTGQTGLQLIETEYLSVEVPADWTVVTREPNSITVHDPKGSHLSLQTYPASGLPSPTAYVQRIVMDAMRRYPDTTTCEEPQASPVPGGPPEGIAFALCYTLTAENGQAVSTKSVHVLGFGLSHGMAPGGSPVFSYALFAERSSVDNFVDVVAQLPQPSWKLYVGP